MTDSQHPADESPIEELVFDYLERADAAPEFQTIRAKIGDAR